MKNESVLRLKRIARTLSEYTDPALRFMGEEVGDIVQNETLDEFGLTELEASLVKGSKVIDAIKEYRKRTGCTLVAAKDYIYNVRKNWGVAPQ